jgi:hypothetical protein
MSDMSSTGAGSAAQARAAMDAAMSGAGRRQDFYQANPGVPAEVPLPADPQVTGVSDHPLLAGGE